MDMMNESAAWMVGLMAFLVLLVSAVLVTVRIYGERAERGDHPHAPAVVRRALVAAVAGKELSAERRRDAVEDVGLGDHEALDPGARQDP